MDSNGSRYILLDRAADFSAGGAECVWDAALGAFTLARSDQPRLPRPDPADALARWRAAAAHVLDDHGQLGRLSDDRRRLEYSLVWPARWATVQALAMPDTGASAWIGDQVLAPVEAPSLCTFVDLHLGGSGLLALPWTDRLGTHGLTVLSLRQRWQARCALPFEPVRAWVDDRNRIWVVGQDRLALCRGAPLPQDYRPRPDRFEPVERNPDPLRLLWSTGLPDCHEVRALACSEAQLAVLVATLSGTEGEGQAVCVRPLDEVEQAPWSCYQVDAAVPLASDLCLLPGERALLLLPFESGPSPARRDCALLGLAAGRAHLLPERWPRKSEASVRFVRHRDRWPRVLRDDGVHGVYRLPQARYLPGGTAELDIQDSGAHATVWHRMYLEASLPPGCHLGIEVRVSDTREQLPACQWEPQPEPLWLALGSELPFAPSAVESSDGCTGLFEVLLQRAGGEARELAGRYLQLRITLSGDGRHSPAIHRIRIWYPRFSWQQHYLPDHFHQQSPLLGDAVADVPANGADVRERVLACCEGLLTPIEDRIAAAESLLFPEAAPPGYLPWLAGFLGAELPPRWPVARQRRWLKALGGLQPRRGTLAALCLELDIVTDGAVSRGQVVPVELFRLRRTVATILGVDLGDEQHPLTLGTRQSGNSRVGDSLILSADTNALVLALFAPELARSAADQAAVADFFARHAQRLVVVLHGSARAQRRSIETALPALLPAAVQWRIVESEHPFVLGLAPLLGIDTYLEPAPPARPVVLEQTRLGRGDTLHNPVALAPEHALPFEAGSGPGGG